MISLDSVNIMGRGCFEGNSAMKIDIRKAFDTMLWSFIFLVLKAFSFFYLFVDQRYAIFKSAKLLVLFNGSFVEIFYYCRGFDKGYHCFL